MLKSMIFVLAMQAVDAPVMPQPVPAPAPSTCSSEMYRQFDFWVGEWEVFSGDQGTKVANSRIERRHAGCAVIENWMPVKGPGGTSLSNVDPATGLWHQKWVGAAPGAVDFTGGMVQGKMVLTGYWPSPKVPHQLVRMTYSPLEDGSVRQYGESSTDHGLTWQTAFDFLYRAKPVSE